MSLPPLTVSEAVAEEPEAAKVLVPRGVFPSENVTVPEGAVDPVAGLTVAVRTVLPVVTRFAGDAVRVVEVGTGGELTATGTEAVELAKFPVAV